MSGREFWAVYDYGMGGVWGVARADSEADVLQTFPELKVVEKRPTWMTGDIEQKLRSVSTFAVADPSTYPAWLQAMLAQRDS